MLAMVSFEKSALILLMLLMLLQHEAQTRPALSDSVLAPGLNGITLQDEPEDEAYQNRIIPVPALAYSPETSLMMGAVVFYQFKTPAAGRDTRASQLLGSGIYTLNRQIILEAGTNWIQPGETWMHNIYGGYNFFPTLYFAPGFNSLEEDERTVDHKRLFLRAEFLKNIGRKWFTGPIVNFSTLWDVQIHEQEDGSLHQPWARGNPKANTVAGLGWSVRHDQRNSIMSPTEGRYFEITSVVNPAVSGTEGFSSLYFDIRRYLQVTNTHGTVVAGQLKGLFTMGKVPYQAMPGIGGNDIGRGYFYGRFNDQNMGQVQIEVRQPVWWRFGAVAFISAGEVWNRFEDFSLSNPKYAGGAGLRFDLNPSDSMNIRIDYGIAAHGSGVYITIGEAF